jgi:AMP phosphorylase
LPISKVKRVIAETGACIVWGGAVNMAAADDLLIKIRRPLRLDPESLVLASVLAKKKAEGAKFVLIDLPVGRDAKIEDRSKAMKLAKEFESMGNYLGMNVKCAITDGSEPTLPQIGPVFEARAVLEALTGKKHKPLIEKACLLAGILLSMAKGIPQEEGYHMALQRIESGRALEKFREIISAQGGKKNVKPEDLRLGKIRKTVYSKESGVVGHVSNTALSRIARALGAPVDRHAGISLRVLKDDKVKVGDALFDLYADSQEKMKFALKQLESTRVVEIQRILLDVV